MKSGEKKLSLYKKHDFCASRHPRLTVVLVHGIASDSSSFDHALQFLETSDKMKDVRFVTFDLLGSGKSVKDDSLEYNYKDQLEALHNSIMDLDISTPLVLVGHSMGTLIVTRYASIHKGTIKKLILVSPPIYTIKDLENPAFGAAMKIFKEAVSVKNRHLLEEKSFTNSMDKIVADRDNYKTLANIKIPTVLIYGDMDKFIAPHNVSRILKENPEYISAIKTIGRHGVTRDKYTKILEILNEAINETI